MTFVLIPGAGSDAWIWRLVVAELERRMLARPLELADALESYASSIRYSPSGT